MLGLQNRDYAVSLSLEQASFLIIWEHCILSSGYSHKWKKMALFQDKKQTQKLSEAQKQLKYAVTSPIKGWMLQINF